MPYFWKGKAASFSFTVGAHVGAHGVVFDAALAGEEVFLGEEARLAIDASLDEVLWHVCKLDAMAAGHGFTLES